MIIIVKCLLNIERAIAHRLRCWIVDIGLNKLHLPNSRIGTIKVNQPFISSALWLSLIDGDNAAHKDAMCANFLNLFNLTIKADQGIF